ncbi:MAG: aminotransferase class V-fold PLP-dependent enzyme, partial [Desulfobacteraceae bacterium]|nr:aminotransferase class V-fold PLP-dependent enzyme [Desulfobacteraceae bacterium]
MTNLDSTFIRSQFPAFSEPSLDGWGFFENAGGSYTCRQVIDILKNYYTRTKVQPYYNYPASQQAGAAMDAAYTQLAAWLNVGEDEVQFGPSTTQNLYVLAHAFREMWDKGDEIIVSAQDHEANAGFWRRLEKTGIIIKEWGVDPDTAMLNPDDLDALLSPKTRLLAFPHCSNVVAHVNPVADIVTKAKAAADVCVVVDGVAYAPHGLPDIGSLGADIYLFSLYKTWGPHLGLMTIKKQIIDTLPNQGHFFNARIDRKKMMPAGPDHAQIAAAAGVAQYLDAVYDHHFSDPAADAAAADQAEKGRQLKQLFLDHETALLTTFLDWLKKRSDIRIIGPADPALRAPTVSILPKDKPMDDVFAALTAKKIMAGQGHFYGVRPLMGMHIP